jgi:transcriptional regulator with XRE-family HTH domain
VNGDSRQAVRYEGAWTLIATANPARAPALETLRVNVIVGRARARLSQQQLAERAGISRPTVSRLERGVGDVGIDAVQRIADALGIAIADLFVPPSSTGVDDTELARRAAAPNSEFGDARELLKALDEANDRRRQGSTPLERYSRAGRPPVARKAAPGS